MDLQSLMNIWRPFLSVRRHYQVESPLIRKELKEAFHS
ncbi:hypothetical protein Gohar_004295 [Gossypium harknessii]|uniref:Uncharacterized protein n=1 Tax=Gossypium harknessii TaxID=34285 RepID=A0A7J9H4I8_9ROSI|nr:hypothetical protein [Gossypium harknessii]